MAALSPNVTAAYAHARESTISAASYVAHVFHLVAGYINDLLVYVKDCIVSAFAPLVRGKGYATLTIGKVAAAAHSAKDWLYAMFARWRVDSYRLA